MTNVPNRRVFEDFLVPCRTGSGADLLKKNFKILLVVNCDFFEDDFVFSTFGRGMPEEICSRVKDSLS